MKDLTLRNTGDSSLVATLRCEMLSNTPANIEVLEIKDATGKQVDNLVIGGTIYRKLNYSWPVFVAFMTAHSIQITSANSNGSNSVTLN